MGTFALIHSPVCGPETWQSTADVLRARGHQTWVPKLSDDDAFSDPLWQQNAASIANAFLETRISRPLIWVAHSGAGFRLPAYRAAVDHPVAGFIFVDAGLPADGLSQLEAMRQERSNFGNDLAAHLKTGGAFPEWTDEMLQQILPSAEHRSVVLSGLRPQKLRYFDEPIKVPASWPDAPCAYLLFQEESYADYAEKSAKMGWPVMKIEATHFHMLVDPEAVADALIALAGAM
jgi:hypothetical protein